MARLRLTEFDTIPLPNERMSQRLPVERIVRDHPAWPSQTLRLLFDWNEAGQYWTWRVGLPDVDYQQRPIIDTQPITYALPYQFRATVLFLFVDLARNTDEVTPRNLGDEVSLVALPGPRSPGYADWFARQQRLDAGADGDENSEILEI